MRVDRLQLLCYNDHPLYQAPFGVEIDGSRYSVATNAAALVAIESDAFDLASDPGSVPSKVSEWWSLLKANGKRITLSTLKEWAGTKVEPERCTRCGGTQKVKCTACNGTRWVECECDHCGDLHDTKCNECTDGTEPCPECSNGKEVPIRLGKIDGHFFNMELVLRAFAIVDDADSALFWLQEHKDHAILYLGDENWFVIIMGLRREVDKAVPSWSSKEVVTP